MATSNPTAQAAVTVDQYRAFMSAFPTGVAVVTAFDRGGWPCGMTCSSMTSVTLSPPTLLVCLRLGSRTESAVRLTGTFAVNLLRAQARRTAELFCAPVVDRFSRVCWNRSPSGLPWLTSDACASADCVVTGTLEVGDHAVLFGRVKRVMQSAEAPLLYGLRRFHAWNGESPDNERTYHIGRGMVGGRLMVDEGLSRMFAAVHRWAKVRPTGTAVSASDGDLTFAELLEQTRAMAGVLSDDGVRPGMAVGLCLDRSRLSLPGLLAVWWLGATAVPLAKRDPVDRIRFVLGDSGVRVLLGDGLPDEAVPRGVRYLRPEGRTSGGTSRRVETPVAPHPLSRAYIIYTSGTTGWPKGVEIAYRSLDAFVSALATLGLSAGGMGINVVSPAFDGWLWCALLYLLHGQGMAILDADGTAEEDLTDRIAAVAPRTVCLTPSLLTACGDAVETSQVLVVAGEPISAGLVARFEAGRRLLNVYGPTETTIAATWADSARSDDVLSIGRALPGYTVQVLDAAYRPVPAGATGELYVGGPAVALGYRNRPDLTAERFVPDPWAGDGSRMYRTGDLVAVRPDGLLEYRSRNDTQVKIRGFRIELTELEQVAGAVIGVRGAAAFVLPSGQALGLAVVTTPGTDAGECIARVRERCAAKLPDHTRPASVEPVLAIPTTASGKVDRAALARSAKAVSVPGGRPASTAQERLVWDVWSSLLDRPITDVDATFFELGGHSLLAARAVAALRRRTGLRVSVRHLLGNPTIAGLARELDRMEESLLQPVDTEGHAAEGGAS